MCKKIFSITTSKQVADAVQSMHRSGGYAFTGRSITYNSIEHQVGHSKIYLNADEDRTQSDVFHDLFFIGMQAQRQVDENKEK